LSIAAGLDEWQGHPIKKQGAVYYIAGEGRGSLSKRIKLWTQYHNIDLDTIPFYVSNNAAQFLDDQEAVRIAVDELFKTTGQFPVLIIVDTLARNFGNGDENDTKDMSKYVAILTSIIHQYKCSTYTIHHSGLSNTERARGAVALKAAADWEYRFEKKKHLRKMVCTKSKDYDEPAEIFFQPEEFEITGWLDEDNIPLKSVVLIKTDATADDEEIPLKGQKKKAYDALILSIIENRRPAVSFDMWMACLPADFSTSSKQESIQRIFRRTVDDLVVENIVNLRNNSYSTIDLSGDFS
jgi:hypothetical protein